MFKPVDQRRMHKQTTTAHQIHQRHLHRSSAIKRPLAVRSMGRDHAPDPDLCPIGEPVHDHRHASKTEVNSSDHCISDLVSSPGEGRFGKPISSQRLNKGHFNGYPLWSSPRYSFLSPSHSRPGHAQPADQDT